MKKILTALAVAPLIVLTACSGSSSDAQSTGQKLTEEAFEKQQKAVPYPADELGSSLERANIRRKLLREENPDAVGYVYIMSFGRFIGYYTIKGKVSSNQSQMTTDQLIVKDCASCSGRSVVSAPGDDGSYGENEDGIFFFTTTDAYISTNMDYVFMDQPMSIDVPELIK